ncbi:hypothetical protein [Micromonospora sp. WMMD812]|uniref:hypothetical protein n=1 Tax=Micromonospora sp. WMMD812 TaxID=3015152 RepID=UPI00248C73CD|nr:hypothetical protein [Micromonospora sp. WMMD812]WBB69547.1 hypothetical protein O7603_09410 [Micromonospora sp. WMMD812]
MDEHRFLSLGAALTAGGVLLLSPFAPPPGQPPPPPTAAQAWPGAQRGRVPADLTDGMPYTPILFFDAARSVGSAPSPDARHLRLVLQSAGGRGRELRRLTLDRNPAFERPATDGEVLVWVESFGGGYRELWAADLHGGVRPRRLTASLGYPLFHQTQYDLVIAEGRVHWVAAGSRDDTEVRSVSLTGGAVEVRTEPGRWAMTAWPWLVDSLTDLAGTGRLRNLLTGQERAMPWTRSSLTECTPTWCRAVSADDDGWPIIEVVRSDGSDRRVVARRTATTVVTDVAVLNRFELFVELAPTTRFTGRGRLMVYDLATGQTVQISPEAGNVAYRAGVLWWTTGTPESFVRHSIDLRTV